MAFSLDCEQSLGMVTRAKVKNKKPRGSWGGGFFPPLSSFPLGHFTLSSPAELLFRLILLLFVECHDIVQCYFGPGTVILDTNVGVSRLLLIQPYCVATVQQCQSRRQIARKSFILQRVKEITFRIRIDQLCPLPN